MSMRSYTSIFLISRRFEIELIVIGTLSKNSYNSLYTVPPNIIDESSSSDTLATEGMRVTLRCHAEGNPTPTIKWRREDGNEFKICDEKNSFK